MISWLQVTLECACKLHMISWLEVTLECACKLCSLALIEAKRYPRFFLAFSCVSFMSNKQSPALSLLVDCPMLFSSKGLQECSWLLESLEDSTAFVGNMVGKVPSHTITSFAVCLSFYCCEFHTKQAGPRFVFVGWFSTAVWHQRSAGVQLIVGITAGKHCFWLWVAWQEGAFTHYHIFCGWSFFLLLWISYQTSRAQICLCQLIVPCCLASKVCRSVVDWCNRCRTALLSWVAWQEGAFTHYYIFCGLSFFLLLWISYQTSRAQICLCWLIVPHCLASKVCRSAVDFWNCWRMALLLQVTWQKGAITHYLAVCPF